jgi:tetratricopeptide (TPR) repeat protein
MELVYHKQQLPSRTLTEGVDGEILFREPAKGSCVGRRQVVTAARGSGGSAGDDAMPTQVLALPAAERQVLAALAVVGRASLSQNELAALVEVEQVGSLIADLERRGLIQKDQKERYSVLGRIGEEIRKTDDALATGDRLLKYMTTLAEGGRLTPERLVDDAEAILGLSEWASERRQLAQLLELVKTLQACFSIAHRVEEWIALLHRGRAAAQALGDRQSEVWALQQLATASAGAGNTAEAQQYLREAEELQRGRGRTLRRRTGADGAGDDIGRMSASRIALWVVGLIAVAGAGLGAGYAIGDSKGNVGSTTVELPVTVTGPGGTLTTSETVTLPATTVLSTTTVLTTTTVITTATPPPVP